MEGKYKELEQLHKITQLNKEILKKEVTNEAR